VSPEFTGIQARPIGGKKPTLTPTLVPRIPACAFKFSKNSADN
jgi:hypothetical protein